MDDSCTLIFKTKYIFVVLVIFFCFAEQAVLGQGKLHLIIVIDKSDPKIGTDKDLASMLNLGEGIALYTDLELVPTTIEVGHSRRENGKNNKLEILQWRKLVQTLDSLQCSPQDVIWFYYSGHGVREATGLNSAPMFAASSDIFSMDKVHRKLGKLNPYLLITFFDCCSQKENAFGIKFKGGAPVDLADKFKNYQQLFRELPENIKNHGIRIMSNDPQTSRVSYGSQQYGGVFTQIFCQTFSNFVNREDSQTCTWANILEAADKETRRVIENCPDCAYTQKPAYLLGKN